MQLLRASEKAISCSISGKIVTLGTSTPLTAASTVVISYTRGSGAANTKITSTADIEALNFAALIVSNNIKPDVTTIIATGKNTIEITYDVALKTSNTVSKTSYSIIIGSTAAAQPSTVALSSNKVTLTTASDMTGASTIKVAYTKSNTASENVQNGGGTATADSFLNTAHTVQNKIIPQIISGGIKAIAENTIEIEYDTNLAASAANTGKSQWTFKINGGSAEAAAGASVSNTKVTLTTTTAMVRNL